jgi:hypothetical protein
MIGLAAYADLLQDGGKLGPRRRDLDAEGANLHYASRDGGCGLHP